MRKISIGKCLVIVWILFAAVCSGIWYLPDIRLGEYLAMALLVLFVLFTWLRDYHEKGASGERRIKTDIDVPTLFI